MPGMSDAAARLDHVIARTMRATGLPGMAVALTDRARLLHVSAHGFADVAARVPVTPETLFEIGSISKSFTSIALLRQRDAGRVDPRDPVTRHLPWFQVRSAFAPIAVAHLLNHTAGIIRGADMTPGSRYEVAALRETETAWPPGQRFYYSNVGYQALGYLLEDALGQTYGDIMRAHVLDPLGMTATAPVITHETRTRLAIGYRPFYDDRPAQVGQPLAPAPWLEYGGGDGSIASTPIDMAVYLRMLLNRGVGPRGRILSEEGFGLLIQPSVERGDHTSYGFGLEVSECDGHTYIGHSGGMVGYRALILADMDDGLGAVVLTNGEVEYDVTQLALDVLPAVAQFAIDLTRAVAQQRALPPLPRAPVSVGATDAAVYAGAYRSATATVTITAEGDQVMLRHNQDCIALERRGGDDFFVNHPDFALFLLRFGREGDRIVEAFHGPDRYTNDRYRGPLAFAHSPPWDAYPGHYRAHTPWTSNFRVALRKGALVLIMPGGDEQRLTPLGDGVFGVGERGATPERLCFDTVIAGRALRACLSGCHYYRSFTP